MSSLRLRSLAIGVVVVAASGCSAHGSDRNPLGLPSPTLSLTNAEIQTANCAGVLDALVPAWLADRQLHQANEAQRISAQALRQLTPRQLRVYSSEITKITESPQLANADPGSNEISDLIQRGCGAEFSSDSSSAPSRQPPSPTQLSATALSTQLRSAAPPSRRIGAYSVRSVSDYVWADGGPPSAAATLRFDLDPKPPSDLPLIRLIVYKTANLAYQDLSTTAGNFGADDIGQDPAIGRPAAQWGQADGSRVCEMQFGRVIVDVNVPGNSYDPERMAEQVVAWLKGAVPTEDSLTHSP